MTTLQLALFLQLVEAAWWCGLCLPGWPSLSDKDCFAPSILEFLSLPKSNLMADIFILHTNPKYCYFVIWINLEMRISWNLLGVKPFLCLWQPKKADLRSHYDIYISKTILRLNAHYFNCLFPNIPSFQCAWAPHLGRYCHSCRFTLAKLAWFTFLRVRILYFYVMQTLILWQLINFSLCWGKKSDIITEQCNK